MIDAEDLPAHFCNHCCNQAHSLGTAHPHFADSASNSFKYSCHTAAHVCVPWPCVWSEIGISTNLPWGTRLISCSAIPSSGGLMKSSAEFTNITGALTVSSFGEGS